MASREATERVDKLLERLGAEYRALPRNDSLPLLFREALARVGLPGGYVARGAAPRALSETITCRGRT